MNANSKIKIATILIVLSVVLSANAQVTSHLKKNGDITQLILDGKPFLALAGELQNSSGSNLEYLDHVFPDLKAMNLNTILAPVSWQLVEPGEGDFDFSLVDGMLEMARKNDLKLVFLWFGTWKNGLSHYAPEWVKEDFKRFPRVKLENGKATETISPFCIEARDADMNAFRTLMAHLKEVDGNEGTVIMMQVENEVGILGAPRDYSDMANAEFEKPVPKELMIGLKKYKDELQPEMKEHWAKTGFREEGRWKDVFGDELFAEEVFMAWQYAGYMNSIAEAGKAEYNIPMFVNAWIVQPLDERPGDYPAGGPQSHLHDVWRIAAPNIDMKCPDIYLRNFSDITAMYHHSWNPLFIPESFSGTGGAANAFYAIGTHAAIGYSPFGIDGRIHEPSESPLAKAYNVLNQLTPFITEAQVRGDIKAFSLSKENDTETVELGGYKIEFSLQKSRRTGEPLTDNGYGMIILRDKDEFILAGSNLQVIFVPASPGPAMAGFVSIFEGEYVDGQWNAGRLLNGDNVMIDYDLASQSILNRTGTGAKLGNEPGILQIKLYRFE